MIRKNNNQTYHHRVFVKSIDGVELVLPVDQFPVQSFNKNDCGFPKSDITIFDELSRSANLDMSLFNAFAKRICAIPSEKRNGLSDEDLIKMYRPAWIQTPSEMVSYVEWFHNTFQARPDLVEHVTQEEVKPKEEDKPKEEVVIKNE